MRRSPSARQPIRAPSNEDHQCMARAGFIPALLLLILLAEDVIRLSQREHIPHCVRDDKS